MYLYQLRGERYEKQEEQIPKTPFLKVKTLSNPIPRRDD
jgi:hypothetical protein